MDKILASAVSVVVMDRGNRSIYRKLFKIWAPMAVQLGVQVGEYPTLE